MAASIAQKINFGYNQSMLFSLLILAIAFLVSLSIHEMAHAYMADRLGDPTAQLEGRVTLNPFAHLDPVGTLLPFVLIMTGSPIVFGWGKPVPFDPFNLRHPRRDSALISLSGPVANLTLAALLSAIVRLAPYAIGSSAYILGAILTPAIILNVSWAIFNLIPIHPLDGGKVLVGFLPKELAYQVDDILNQFGMIVLIFLLFPFRGFSPVSTIIAPIVQTIVRLLLPGAPLV